MKKEQLQVTEAVEKFNELANARVRFFVGAAVKDALVLGNRSELITEQEAQDLLDIIETDILQGARNDARVQEFLKVV